MEYSKPYVAPILTVDLVAFQMVGDKLHVLLMKRPNEPFKGSWALPGGYNPEGETTTSALERIMHQKVGISIHDDLSYIEQLYTFDTVARDPRGHAVSVTYMGCSQQLELDMPAATSALFPVDDLPGVAYDHKEIVDYARKRLAAKLSYTNVAFALLPETFSLGQLQGVYEGMLGRPLDKRNFRKQVAALNFVVQTDQMETDAAHRPARLYRFRMTSLTETRELAS